MTNTSNVQTPFHISSGNSPLPPLTGALSGRSIRNKKAPALYFQQHENQQFTITCQGQCGC
jgi:hypothetical protein